MHKKLLFIALAWLCAVTGMADTLTILNRFEKIEHASVLASYRNEFGSYRKPNMDVEFPYALIRVHIEGNEAAVTKAKERFALYLGQHYTTKAKNTSRVNEIMFLVPIGAGHVELQCGDGCQPLTLFDYSQLTADAIYEGKVRYAMEKQELIQSTTTQAPKRQFFKFRVSPADAIVEVEANGQKYMWHVSEGVASKPLNYGTYRYTISSNRYHTESGTFLVSDTETEKQVTLQPKFGWLSITSNNAQDAYVYVTNTQTGTRQSLGTVPVRKKDLDAGTYTLLIQKDKYKDYTSNFTIEEGKTLSLDPTLEANFVELTLTTSAQSDMYIDGEKLGIGRWTGTLELGEYVVETRQASHQSAYTRLYVTSKSAGKTIALNNPIPIYGSMMLTSSPSDAVVYVDGVKKGSTPLIVNELLIGKHAIRIEKEGYKSVLKEVTVEENKEHSLEYELIKTTTTPTTPPVVNPPQTLPVREQKAIAKNKNTRSNTLVPSKKKTYILANAATPFKDKMWGVGLTFGQMYNNANGMGWYVKGRSNFQALKTLSGLQCDEDFKLSTIDKATFWDYNQDGVNDIGITPILSGETKASTWLVGVGCTADFLHKKNKRNKNSAVALYAGLGYAASCYGLETIDGKWIEYAPWSATGVSVDAGLMASMGGFTVTVGLTTINFETVDAEFSIGWMF